LTCDPEFAGAGAGEVELLQEEVVLRTFWIVLYSVETTETKLDQLVAKDM